MGLTLAQLLTPLSAAQVRANAVLALQALGLQPTLWPQGGIASSILTVSCNVIATLSTELSNAIAQNWNPTASGAGLQMLSQYYYGLTPPQATFASGAIQLTNTGGGVYTFAAGQATFGSTVANSQGTYPQYTNTASFTLLAGSPSSPTVLSVPVTCTTIGTAGNSNPGFVSQLVTGMLGVACTNPLPILGSDGLSDAALRAFNMNSLAVRGTAFGPRGAYAYAIQQATNTVSGQPVNVNRWSISPSSHYGQVTIYVASPGGTVITTDLQGISVSIEALARPDCVTVLPGLSGYPAAPASATVVNYEPSITVYVAAPRSPTGFLSPIQTAQMTAANLQTVIVNYLVAWFESPSNPIGGLVASDDILVNFQGIFESGISGLIGAAVSTVPGCYVLSTRFALPGDLALDPGEVAAWGGSITVQVQFV